METDDTPPASQPQASGHRHDGCCGHDHGPHHHEGHEAHSHDTCCGHGHSHSHSHHHESAHEHPHDHCCGHHHHENETGCCHEHDHEECGHAHAAGAGAAFGARFFHWLGCALLILWGAVMLYYFASGRIIHYLTGNGTFRIQCLFSGLALFILAIFNFVYRSGGAGHSHGHQHDGHNHGHHGHEHGADCGHDHSHAHGSDGSWISKLVAFLILGVPLAAAAVYSPDRYSDEFMISKVHASTSSNPNAALGGPVDLAKRAEKMPPSPSADGAIKNPNDFTVEELERLSGGRTPEGHIPLQLVELFYMPAQTRDVQAVVATQTIETVGQAIKDRQDPTKMRLFRMMMTCCAADARPISMPVEFENAPPEWREMGWYKLIGTVEYRDIAGVPTTIFKATALEPSKAPRQQMLY